jgi:hypothetical protein
MQINEEAAGTENLKILILNWQRQKPLKPFKTLHEYRWYRKNYQIDEAYLLLGKARYYDQRLFLPRCLQLYLYKYPNSSNIYEAKIWREKQTCALAMTV